jgi:hypothetical protein
MHKTIEELKKAWDAAKADAAVAEDAWDAALNVAWDAQMAYEAALREEK